MSIEKSKAKEQPIMSIELHAIQSFGPSNLNRDDAGYPKEAFFGGIRRPRISSQALKYATRHSDEFKDAVGVPLGIRTKRQVPAIVEELARDGIDEDWTVPRAKETLIALYGKGAVKAEKKDTSDNTEDESKKKANSKDKDSAQLFTSEQEFQAIVRFLADAHANNAEPDIQAFCKAQRKALKDRTEAPDIATSGRMLPGKPNLNIEAACQVAHALSTHGVSIPESDFFTAVDDLRPAETRGAAMMGVTYFNSATYYRICILDWRQLVSNLGGDTDLARRTIRGLMDAFVSAVPKGKTNSFVNQHWPAFLLAVARPDNNAKTLSNAFERPVRASNGGGYIEPSILALCRFWDQTEAGFGRCAPFVAVLNPHGFELPSKALAGAQVQNLSAWIEAITDLLGEA